MTQRTPHTFTIASVGTPYSVDFRSAEDTTRAIYGTLTTGDTISVLVSPNPVSISGEVWVTVAAFTATTFVSTLTVPMARIRVDKAGANGVANVVGIL